MAIVDFYSSPFNDGPESSYHDEDDEWNTGFLPSEIPLERLPNAWEIWESTLDRALGDKFKLGSAEGITPQQESQSAEWREHVRQLPILPTEDLRLSEPVLRRAHLVLAFILHIYIHTTPPTSPIIIPPSLGVPLIQISNTLDIPCDVTYSDTVLYNWRPKNPSLPLSPDNIESQTLFTGTMDEQEFYLASTRIEIRAVEALRIVNTTMDDLAVSSQRNNNTRREITARLQRLSQIIIDMKVLLMNVTKSCHPTTYYHTVRPWLSGQDSDPHKRKWVFAGLSAHGLEHPTELSGPSAGQSTTIHVLDTFLGIQTTTLSPPRTANQPSFQDRMRLYMPRRHRTYLDNMSTHPSLRAYVLDSQEEDIMDAFNACVRAMKDFRDAHMIIATMYIVSPARRAEKERLARKIPKTSSSDDREEETERRVLKGTGGTDLVRFLKDVRENTLSATINILR